MSSAPYLPLGIIACPGGKFFAQQLVEEIEKIELLHFEQRTCAIAESYSLEPKDISRRFNLVRDLLSGERIATPSEVERYRTPKFLVEAKFTRFANGEVKTEILDGIRSRDVYIVQDIYTNTDTHFEGSPDALYGVNDHLMTLMTTVDAVRSCSPGRITCILPAYPYARQHKRKGREGLTAALIGSQLESMGVDRILTLDVHSRDIDNAFTKLQLVSLHASYEILRCMVKILDHKKEDMVVVAPDTGAVDRNKYYANSLGCPLAMLYKERDYSVVSTSAQQSNISLLRLLGNVEGKTVFLADDMLGTGGTLIKALRELKNQGAGKIIIGISLPLCTGDSIERLEEAYREGSFYRLISTNAVGNTQDLFDREWYICADVGHLFAQAIAILHHDGSLSPLLDNKQQIQMLLNKND
ncbi:MAG: ribose-phosphate diphosphokinase [Spirochaetia bacterium]